GEAVIAVKGCRRADRELGLIYLTYWIKIVCFQLSPPTPIGRYPPRRIDEKYSNRRRAARDGTSRGAGCRRRERRHRTGPALDQGVDGDDRPVRQLAEPLQR